MLNSWRGGGQYGDRERQKQKIYNSITISGWHNGSYKMLWETNRNKTPVCPEHEGRQRQEEVWKSIRREP